MILSVSRCASSNATHAGPRSLLCVPGLAAGFLHHPWTHPLRPAAATLLPKSVLADEAGLSLSKIASHPSWFQAARGLSSVLTILGKGTTNPGSAEGGTKLVSLQVSTSLSYAGLYLWWYLRSLCRL